MKKICMIVPGFDARGGIASVVKGYRGSELEKKYHIRYIETYCDGGKAAKLWKALGAYLRFVGVLITFRPDLIHVHSSFGASFYRKLPFLWAGSLLRIPVVNHIHGADWENFYNNSSEHSKKLKKKAFKRCDKVIALSDTWRNHLSTITDLKKIEVIHNYGIDRFSETYEKDGMNQILFLGFLCDRKGCFLIPEIVSIVKAAVGDVKFVLAGSGVDEDLHRLKMLIDKFDVYENIVLPGWIKEKQKESYLKQASIFFLPSYAEGMPMSILEAMGAGLPIVSTNVGGIPQLVQQGENGILCEPGDVRAFADALIRLLQNARLREKMGMRSLDIMQADFSLKTHTDGIGRVYEKILNPESE